MDKVFQGKFEKHKVATLQFRISNEKYLFFFTKIIIVKKDMSDRKINVLLISDMVVERCNR